MALVDQRNGSAADDADVSTTTKTTTVTQEDGSVVTTKTTHVTTTHKGGELKTVQKFYTYQDGALSPEERDIDFLKRNSSKRRSLNKEAYLKLHRNTTNRKSIEVLKGKYEIPPEDSDKTIDKVKSIKIKDYGSSKKRAEAKGHNDAVVKELQSKLSPKLSKDTVESLKEKYSPSNFGYPNLDEVKLRKKPVLPKKPKSLVLTNPPIRISTVSVGTVPVAQQLKTIPGHEVILRSSSEDSIEKLESFMSEFTMDPKREVKEKKRTSSFRKILTGGLFSKDKKKSEKRQTEEKSKNKKTENVVVADNVQNEQVFNRNSTHRHTVDNHYTKPPIKASHDSNIPKEYIDSTTNNLNETERRYAELHINQFNKIKATFSHPENFNKATNNTYQYLHENDNSSATIDRYIDTSSSSNTLESVDRGTYQNALIAQAELKQIKENEIRAKQMEAMLSTKQAISPKKQENFVETPPRAKEMYQNVQLVKPKALIPINSERALPNPYHNGQDGRQHDDSKKSLEKNFNVDEKDYGTYIPIYNRQNNLNDVAYEYNTNKTQHQDQRQYSPNLTKSSNSSSTQNSPSSPSFSSRSSPRSPTLEGSKLRLPINREKVNLQPRIKSPIPQPKVSTEKIIATELLKNKSETRKQGATPSPIPQKVANYEEYTLYEPKPVTAQIVRQSPVPVSTRKPDTSSVIDPFEAAKWHQKQRELAVSPTLNDSAQVVTNVMVHADPEMKRNSLQYSSLPVTMRKPTQDVISMRQRPVTPVKKAPSIQSLQQSPQKHEMRQNVELYCWKEIQKLKEKQDQELKYQLQYTPYGYVEDPIIQRRSRSVEPGQQRNTKRSTSLPREVKPNLNSRIYYREPIPENRPMNYGEDDIYAQKNSEFLRNSPQRRTVSGTLISPQKSSQMYEGYYANSGEVPYRPIFNRGSLNPQTQQDAQNQLLQKKVSFTGNRNPAQDSPWPTRNGYVQNPPQRRIEKAMSVGDDEVFLRDTQIKQLNEQIQKQLIKDGQVYSTRDSLMSLPRQQNLLEPLYGSRTGSVSAQNNNQMKYINLLPHEKISNEPTYVSRQNKQNITELTKQKQENLQNIYGTKQQPDVDPLYAGQIYQVRSQQLVPMQDVRDNGSIINEPINNSKAVALERYYTNNNLVADSPYGNRRVVTSSPVTKVIKQVTVTNKVCDIYGNIHDNGKRVPVSPPSPAQIQQTGVIYGQLQGNVMGRPPQYQSYNQIVQPTNFVRGSRLTASANDMYKRYPTEVRRREVLYEESPYGQRVTNFNPNGPLPPTPNEQSKMQLLMMRRSNTNRGYPILSDTESETSEVRRIMNRNYADGK